MRSTLLFLLLLLHAVASSQLLIRNVTVVDVVEKKLLPSQSVLIENGVITAMGAKVKTPSGAQELDGEGRYLMPGLVDAHVHFFQSGSIYTRPDVIDLRKYRPYEEEIQWTHNNMGNLLRRYAYSGITSVIDVGATHNMLRLRDSLVKQKQSPTVYMTGPLLTTWAPDAYKGLGRNAPFYEMKTVEDARQGVREQLPHRPDFIKIWFIVLSDNKDSGARALLPLVKAAIDEAHANGLRVAVHATERITAQLSVEAGADLLVHGVEDEPLQPSFIQLLKARKVVLTPTLVVSNNYINSLSGGYRLHAHDFKYAHPTPLNSLVDFQHLPDTALTGRLKRNLTRYASINEATNRLMAQNTRALLDGGVTLAVGTDAGNIGTHHVSSYLDELKAMQGAGLSTMQLLQAATINGAKAMGKENEFGSVSKGKRADLLLLNANPLDSISNWLRIHRVINRGTVFHPDSLLQLSPVELAEQQLVAYNSHNLDLFVQPYADSVEVYPLPGTRPDVSGIAAFRKNYEFLNYAPDLYCRIRQRIIQSNVIIDEEEVTFDKNKPPVKATAIYYFSGGKIRKVWFPDL